MIGYFVQQVSQDKNCQWITKSAKHFLYSYVPPIFYALRQQLVIYRTMQTLLILIFNALPNHSYILVHITLVAMTFSYTSPQLFRKSSHRYICSSILYITTQLASYTLLLFTLEEINFTGPDNNFTMSNSDDSLYLKGRTGNKKDVVVKEEDVSDCK